MQAVRRFVRPISGSREHAPPRGWSLTGVLLLASFGTAACTLDTKPRTAGSSQDPAAPDGAASLPPSGAAGTPSPSGAAGTPSSAGGAGAARAADSGAIAASQDAGADSAVAQGPFNTPSICSSGAYWTDGDNGSARMHPGGECIACHALKDGPPFVLAGTVYPSAHEPIDCNGIDGSSQGVQVVITGADGHVTTLSVNSVGNFHTEKKVAMPFHAKVVSGGRERQMSAAQMTGDCNHCHTETGANGAPGRIVAP